MYVPQVDPGKQNAAKGQRATAKGLRWGCFRFSVSAVPRLWCGQLLVVQERFPGAVGANHHKPVGFKQQKCIFLRALKARNLKSTSSGT